MLRTKRLLICLTAVAFCFVGIASANAVGGSAGSYDSYDDAYFVIDCYQDGNGNTWVLLWDMFDDSTRWVVVWRVPTQLVSNAGPGSLDGNPGATLQGREANEDSTKQLVRGMVGLPIETIPLPEYRMKKKVARKK